MLLLGAFRWQHFDPDGLNAVVGNLNFWRFFNYVDGSTGQDQLPFFHSFYYFPDRYLHNLLYDLELLLLQVAQSVTQSRVKPHSISSVTSVTGTLTALYCRFGVAIHSNSTYYITALLLFLVA